MQGQKTLAVLSLASKGAICQPLNAIVALVHHARLAVAFIHAIAIASLFDKSSPKWWRSRSQSLMSPTKQPFCATDWTCIMHQHQSTTQLNNQRTHKRHSLFQVALVQSSHAMASHVALVTSGAASAVRRTYHGGCVGRISL